MKKLKGVIDAQRFDKKTIEKVFEIAGQMESVFSEKILEGKIMATLFYEPSTRTRLSFESAMMRLGGKVIGTENAKEFSSKAKGESLEDSVRIVSGYADLIVLRYHKEGGAERAQKFSTVPIINAGDGPGQHPTQALLDLYTIKKCQGKISKLKIALIGDLLNGRTVRSLCYFLAKHYPDNYIYLISPKQTRMKKDIKNYLNKNKIKWEEREDLLPIVSEIDIFYQTRVQEERFKDNPDLYKEVVKAAKRMRIDAKVLAKMKKNACIMHPLPRVGEIDYAVDRDPRAVYFQQAQNGLYVRMALLKMILSGY